MKIPTFLTRSLNFMLSSIEHVKCFAALEQGWVDPRPGLQVIKLFSSSGQLSMKFYVLINVEKYSKLVEISGSKLKNNCWHFNIYEQDKF